MAYSLCDMGGAPGCPAGELCEAKRLVMWDAIEAIEAEGSVSGAERTETARDAIEAKLEASPNVDSYTQSEISRLAMAAVHIAAGRCEQDTVSINS